MSVPDINPHMGNHITINTEKDEITAGQLTELRSAATACLVDRAPRQCHADFLVDVLHKTTAIKPLWSRTTPLVGSAKE